MTLKEWLNATDSHIDINGALHHPRNQFVNAHIKQNSSPYGRLEVFDSGQFSSVYGRSNDAIVENAVDNLMRKLYGKEVRFGNTVLRFPESFD